MTAREDATLACIPLLAWVRRVTRVVPEVRGFPLPWGVPKPGVRDG